MVDAPPLNLCRLAIVYNVTMPGFPRVRTCRLPDDFSKQGYVNSIQYSTHADFQAHPNETFDYQLIAMGKMKAIDNQHVSQRSRCSAWENGTLGGVGGSKKWNFHLILGTLQWWNV